MRYLIVLVLSLSLGGVALADERALLKAAKNGRVVDIRQQLDAGVIVDAADRKKRTALMLAAGAGEDAAVELLLERGASLTLRDKGRRTARNWALKKKRKSVVETIDFYAAADSNDVATLKKFTSTYTNSKYTPAVVARLDEANFVVAVRANTKASFQKYVADYPAGRSRSEALDLLHDKWWASLQSKNKVSIDDLQGFADQYPNSPHQQAARTRLAPLLARKARSRADGRVPIDKPQPLSAQQVEGLKARVAKITSPFTARTLAVPLDQRRLDSALGASTARMNILGDITDAVRVKTKDGRTKSFTGVYGSESDPPLGLNVRLDINATMGAPKAFQDAPTKLLLVLKQPDASVGPLAFKQVSLFDKRVEWEYSYDGSGWNVIRLELEPAE